MGKSQKERRHLAIAAARLYSEKKLQTEIAEFLHLSQPEVSRLLQEAENKLKIINVHPTLIRGRISDQDWQIVEYKYFSDKELIEKLKAWSPKGIFSNLRISEESEEDFCEVAAQRLLELVANSKTAGVLWGRTIRSIVDRMREHAEPIHKNKPFHCIPLCGDPIHAMNQDDQNFSASHLAADLEKVLTGATLRTLPSLTGVPAYLPQSLLDAKEGSAPIILEEFIHKIPGYNKIFLDRDGSAFVNRVDTLLTGVGILSATASSEIRQTGAFLRERINQEGLKTEDLSKLVLGDFGGILISKEGLNATDRSRVEQLNMGWLGINENQISRIAQSATKSGRPGVIVVAREITKGEIVRECVKRGLVNELIIDVSLSRRLKELQ